MLDIVTTSFFIKNPVFDRDAFEEYSSALFDEWDAHVESHLRLADYSLTLVIEEGSISGRGKIAASAALFYFAIGNYGDFISGLKTIQEQASFVNTVLFDKAKSHFNCSDVRGNVRKDGGELLYLAQLFDRVQSSSVTTEQAMREIRKR